VAFDADEMRLARAGACAGAHRLYANSHTGFVRPAWHTAPFCHGARILPRVEADPPSAQSEAKRASGSSEPSRPSRSRLSQITSCHLASLDLAQTTGYRRVNILSPKLTETGGLRWSNAEFKSRRTICFPVETSSSRFDDRDNDACNYVIRGNICSMRDRARTRAIDSRSPKSRGNDYIYITRIYASRVVPSPFLVYSQIAFKVDRPRYKKKGTFKLAYVLSDLLGDSYDGSMSRARL